MRYNQAFYPKWDEQFADQLRDQFELDPKQQIRRLSRGQRAARGCDRFGPPARAADSRRAIERARPRGAERHPGGHHSHRGRRRPHGPVLLASARRSRTCGRSRGAVAQGTGRTRPPCPKFCKATGGWSCDSSAPQTDPARFARRPFLSRRGRGVDRACATAVWKDCAVRGGPCRHRKWWRKKRRRWTRSFWPGPGPRIQPVTRSSRSDGVTAILPIRKPAGTVPLSQAVYG